MVREHRISVTESEAVSTVHHPAEGDAWVVFCHGFLSDKTGSYERRCERAVAEGYDAVRFDFRGSGDSDGAFVDQTLTSRIADLRAVVDHFDPPTYVPFGSSFGGAVALYGAVDDPRVGAIVVRAPVTRFGVFDDYRSAVDERGVIDVDGNYAIDERFFADLDGYDIGEVGTALDVPVAVFHGREDTSVPLTDSLETIGALQSDVLVQAYADEGHRFSAAADARMCRQAFDWLATVCKW